MPAKDDSRVRERERAALVAAGVEITAGCLLALHALSRLAPRETRGRRRASERRENSLPGRFSLQKFRATLAWRGE
jgi:hypothetical protein